MRMMLASLTIALSALAGLPAHAASLVVEGESFTLATDDGRHLTSADLTGAVLQMTDVNGAHLTVRIESVAPAAERPTLLLHKLSVLDPATGGWHSYCQADAKGRQAGFPVAGAFDGGGRYVKDPSRWFITCTSGSQGKCILFGYDPWRAGPKGEDLAPYYQACQHMVRADYDGRGAAHTRNGTMIDISDRLGIQVSDSQGDPRYAFEAGWGPDGAVCVARTRWPDLLPRDVIIQSAPRLNGRCDEAAATARGALLFNRSK